MIADATIKEAIEALVIARERFNKAANEKLILGNDNHIGDIGEYWVRKYFEMTMQFKQYAGKKNAPYDLELKNGQKVSVKTITSWSKIGKGTQIKPLCGEHWDILAAVRLNELLHPEKIALIPLKKLITHEPFPSNDDSRRNKGTKSYPRFEWWPWLDKGYVVYTPNQDQ
jgi:hypothetical protein